MGNAKKKWEPNLLRTPVIISPKGLGKHFACTSMRLCVIWYLREVVPHSFITSKRVRDEKHFAFFVDSDDDDGAGAAHKIVRVINNMPAFL